MGEFEQVLQARGSRSQGRPRDRFGESLELVAAGDEVGLAIHFNQGSVVAGSLDRNRAFRRDTRGFLVGLGEAALAHELSRGVQIALGFDQRLFALHKSSARALSKLLD